MASWREQVRDFAEKCSGEEDYKGLKAVDEFAAADRLDNDSVQDSNGLTWMVEALEQLRARHLAFRRPEKCEECDLETLRLQILTAVTESPDLLDYYREAWNVPADPETDGHAATPTSLSACRRIAVMQVELMVRAFSILQLQRFANAPENHGWMVLFRCWARSPRFNRVFGELRGTLSPDFVKFYDLYLHGLPSFASVHGTVPIHHPWLLPTRPEERRRFRGRGVYMDSGIVEGEIELEVRPGTEGIVDARGPARADQTYETRSDSAKDDGTERAPNE